MTVLQVAILSTDWFSVNSASRFGYINSCGKKNMHSGDVLALICGLLDVCKHKAYWTSAMSAVDSCQELGMVLP